MNCVVLLGFSTTGKSTILDYFRGRYPAQLDVLDSDAWVADEYNNHIYNIFINLTNLQDTVQATNVIEARERQFLRMAGPQDKPLLIAAGPFLPIREPEWTEFKERVHPTCFYLQKSPADVLKGLHSRREKHQKDPAIGGNPRFGCWDNDVTTTWHNGKWVPLSDDEALQNITKHMERIVPLYKHLSSLEFSWEQRRADGGETRLKQAIASTLELWNDGQVIEKIPI